MTRESFLILLGLLVIIAPFAGLPLSWLAWILPLIGFAIVIIGASLRRARAAREAVQSQL